MDRSDLDRCTDAEDYFALLEVPYDPAVVAVNRLHILKRFSAAVATIGERRGPALAEPDPAGRLADYRAALAEAYATFVTSSALDHRLFKVLVDHAPDQYDQVVPVEALVRRGSERS